MNIVHLLLQKGRNDQKEINFYNPEDLEGLEIEYTDHLDQSNLETKKYKDKVKAT